MKFFDSHFDNNIFINKTLAKLPADISSNSKILISKNIDFKNLNLELICKKQSGDSFLNISFFKNKILIKSFKEIIDTNIFSVKKFKYFLSQEPDEILIEKNKGSIGKIIINRIIVSKVEEEFVEINSKIGFIVPYQLYGGAEVYLENLLKNSPNNVNLDLLISRDNKIKNFRFPSNIKIKNYSNNILNFLNANNYEQIIFYNSKKIYNDLLIYKKINPSIKYYEIYHSDFSWPDSMSTVEKRESISAVFKTSSLVGKNINVEDQLICPPPLDFSRFNFSRKKLPIKTMGFIGRLSSEKNPFLAIDICEKLGLKMLIAGDGPLRKDVSEYTIQKRNISFLGWQNPIEFYKRIDCLILTSEMEGVPNVILEALASGLPIISTDVGGISEILSDTISLIFEKNNFNLLDIKNFIEKNYNYNYINILKAKNYEAEKTSNLFFNRILKDFKKPIELKINNNFKTINGTLL